MSEISLDPVKVALDQMTAEKGKRIGSYFYAKFSVKDVLDRIGQENTEPNQNYVRYVVRHFYGTSVVYPGQGDNGGFIEMKIWSK